MVPSFSSHLIAVLTLGVPEMILAETSLSFLGLGLREPVISWGVLLTGVQNIRAVALAPWLFLPGVAIVVTGLAVNFVGDGLRDAADPYAQWACIGAMPNVACGPGRARPPTPTQ